MTSGGITAFDQAEGILARVATDIVGAARQSLADPDSFLKMRLGSVIWCARSVGSSATS